MAEDIDGAHIILKNDADSSTAKNSFLLLSKPRSYQDAAAACTSMTDGAFLYLSGSTAAIELLSLLKSNAAAQAEVTASTNFWVLDVAVPSILGCSSLNKITGATEKTPCITELPIVCINSAPRRTLLVQDTSRQVAVKTSTGVIQGFRDRNSFRFLGIPYAEAPVGNLRFAAPMAKAPFKSTLSATKYGYVCPQTGPSGGLSPAISNTMINGAEENEDCLNLNVHTPSLKGKGQALLPVMFYIHGGGFTMFAGSTIIFEPGNLVSRGGVVVVTINYRLGFLGFTESTPALPRSDVPGNQAIHDQILALRWVKDHIAAFGGDPDRVTVFGESAGAVSIRALLSAPSTWDLYANVIGQSDPLNIPFKSAQDAALISSYFFEAMKCQSNDLVCARSKSVAEVMAAQEVANNQMVTEQNWTSVALIERPSVDGDLISADFSDLIVSGKYNTKANIMWGTVMDEASRFVEHYIPDPSAINAATYNKIFESGFSPSRVQTVAQSRLYELDAQQDNALDLFSDLFTSYYLYCPLQYISRQMAKTTPRTYNFRFNYGRGIPIFDASGFCSDKDRVCHGQDIIPVFGSAAAVPLTSQTGNDARFSRQIIDRWTTFAKTGNPNPSAGMVDVENTNPNVVGVEWLAYDERNPVMELDLEGSQMSFNNGEQVDCAFIESKLKYDFEIHNPSRPPLIR
ncbi:hypothetical protein BGX23_005257 [Mortierella sp. AD031]|nr:hypothetical protein BGX23_005257 [Mortierella sp. AD031]